MAKCDCIKLWANSLNEANLWASFRLLQSHVSCFFPLYIWKHMYVPYHLLLDISTLKKEDHSITHCA